MKHTTIDVPKFDELFEIHEKVKNCRSACEVLYEHKLISKEIRDNIDKSIKEIEDENFCFITKPFATCDSIGKTLFHLMKSMQRNLKVKIETKQT